MINFKPSLELIHFGDYPAPLLENPSSQLCTANQMVTPIYRSWCADLNSPPRFSRKQWEFVYIMQALKVAGMLQPGKQGLGFGCGSEPLTGVFAKYGCEILATDLEPERAKAQGWVDTNQHASSLKSLHETSRRLITWDRFQSQVKFQHVDMNTIPKRFDGQFDFTWSACALEHLGSLQHGLDFIKNSVRCLKPGGVAVHTTEFNLLSDDATVETPSCSIYRARDIKKLIAELESEGYTVSPLNLNTGAMKVDNHIDAPPYGFSPHLKLLLSEYVVTSIGLIIRRKPIE